MRILNNNIEKQAEELLLGAGALTIPVPVELVASHLDLAVEDAELGDGISGVLVIEGERGTIGVNSGDRPVRKRFTIAHEIGHFVLHRGEDVLFIDDAKRFFYRRELGVPTAADWLETTANQFAAALLMPRSLIEEAVADLDMDLADEDELVRLAKHFKVSPLALSYRLVNLEILSDFPG